MHNIRGLIKKGPADRERNKYFFPSLHSEKGHAPHFAQQYRSSCHSGHFHRARSRIPQRECVHANKTCSHSSQLAQGGQGTYRPYLYMSPGVYRKQGGIRGTTPFRTRVRESAWSLRREEANQIWKFTSCRRFL